MQISLPQHVSWFAHQWRRASESLNVIKMDADAPMKMWWRYERLLCKNDTGAQALLFGTWQRSLIFFVLSPTKFQWSVSPWRIWSVDCSLASLVSKLCLAFQVSQSWTNIIFWVSFIGLPSSRFNFFKVKSMSLSGCLLRQQIHGIFFTELL